MEDWKQKTTRKPRKKNSFFQQELIRSRKQVNNQRIKLILNHSCIPLSPIYDRYFNPKRQQVRNKSRIPISLQVLRISMSYNFHFQYKQTP